MSYQDPDGDRSSSIFWDPPPGEVFRWKNVSPARPRSLRIYECHVGISGSDARITTYNEFTENVNKSVLLHLCSDVQNDVESCSLLKRTYSHVLIVSHQVLPHIKKAGYNVIQFFGIQEHNDYSSAGYKVAFPLCIEMFMLCQLTYILSDLLNLW
jgi:1,4-alpha-glucan branching enzyme